jgi:hypothetical protein
VDANGDAYVSGRGLPSSTFWLDVSIFCGICWLHE